MFALSLTTNTIEVNVKYYFFLMAAISVHCYVLPLRNKRKNKRNETKVDTERHSCWSDRLSLEQQRNDDRKRQNDNVESVPQKKKKKWGVRFEPLAN